MTGLQLSVETERLTAGAVLRVQVAVVTEDREVRPALGCEKMSEEGVCVNMCVRAFRASAKCYDRCSGLKNNLLLVGMQPA